MPNSKEPFLARILLIRNDDSDGKSDEAINHLEDEYQIIKHDFSIDKESFCTDVDVIIFEETISSSNILYRKIEELKDQIDKHAIPFIILSAFSFAEDRLMGFDSGCADYIAKPFNDFELITRTKTQAQIKVQRDKIKDQKKNITDSINSAKKIQQSILQPTKIKSKFIQDHFVLYVPKDIVSGDFYWSFEFEDKIIIAAADCTGHGVPGALMSMLGITFLNEIVSKDKIVQPNLILDQLREKIINTLNQHEETPNMKEGMDISICTIYDNNRVEFSGAYNSICLIKNGEFIELKADKMPIGRHLKENKPFTSTQVQLNNGDSIYMFSDGYADQFGGNSNKKLMSKNFKKLIAQQSPQKMYDQKLHFENYFNKWKGNLEQIDDILLMGIKLN